MRNDSKIESTKSYSLLDALVSFKKESSVEITQNFDSGNIEIINCSSPKEIEVKIRRDSNSHFYQWFHFRLSGVRKTECSIFIRNATGAAYPKGFQNYQVCCSYDKNDWFRHRTELIGDSLVIIIKPVRDIIYFAYFVPYSLEQHYKLIASSLNSKFCRHEVLGKTIENRDIELISFANGSESEPRKACWITARQHPGETMAEWWMEGFIEQLVDGPNTFVNKLLEECVIYLIPNMNPDGSYRGNLRTNAAGRNLNREWEAPSLEKSPEVYFVKRKMQETGVDFFLDVHGDESLPYCFIAGTEGIVGWDKPKQAQLDFFKERLAQLNPDFQTENGYPANGPGLANLTIGANHIAVAHNCLAMTLEMPFKDTIDTPNEESGWSPLRSKQLAHSCLFVIAEYLNSLY